MSNTILYPYDITIHESTTYDKWFQWIVDDVIVDLTDVTGKMQVRSRITDEDPLIDIPFQTDPWAADGETGIYIMNPADDDRYRIYINNEDSVGLCESHINIIGVYNLFLYNADDECVLKQHGTATIVAAVGRWTV